MSDNQREFERKPSATEGHKLPGGQVRLKPIEIEGTFYNPLRPPKLIRTPDGKEKYIGGRVIDRDEAHSMMFWAKDQPEGLREAMMENIETAVNKGEFASFVGFVKSAQEKVELEQDSKEKLSAYCMLAKEMGHTIGPFRFNENSWTVQASIAKI